MGAYLTARPPARDQWYTKRNRALTGCTVLHSSESAFDEMGVDTGAEGVAEFIRTRTTPGCYHDIVDSDSDIQLAEYEYGVYHDGTGSNNWALSLCFALRTTDWRRMSPVKRRAILHRGAVAFKRQQDYRRRVGAPLTELRLLTKAQTDAGMSGFTYHGYRDPGRRTDPGTEAPDLFPFDEFISECLSVMGGTPLAEDDDMPQLISQFVPAGAEHTYPIPPVSSGAAGWGKAWLSLVVDRHGAPPDPSFVRIAIMGADGQYRPAFGNDPVLPIRPGSRPVTELRKGDQAIVVASLDKTHGAGVLIEYAAR